MTALVAATNIVLGLAYTGYGVMTVVEMRRDAAAFGFSHFGLAWIFMAFTCGPHHLDHGLHVALTGRAGGSLDLFAVVVGLPVGVLWLYLRIEAFLGGRGDRFVLGTPRWLAVMPVVSAMYVIVVVAAMVDVAGGWHRISAMVVANLILVPIYMAIGWFILRTQLTNRPGMGGWSVSGLCLSVIFPTCALMHAVWAAYAVGGRYRPDIHGFTIDWLSIPAGLYFLWVVRGLYRESLRDWNEGPDVVTPTVEAGAVP